MNIINRYFIKSTIEIMDKDLGICAQFGKKADAPFFLGEIAKNMYQQTKDEFDSFEDINTMIKIHEKLANISAEDCGINKG